MPEAGTRIIYLSESPAAAVEETLRRVLATVNGSLDVIRLGGEQAASYDQVLSVLGAAAAFVIQPDGPAGWAATAWADLLGKRCCIVHALKRDALVPLFGHRFTLVEMKDRGLEERLRAFVRDIPPREAAEETAEPAGDAAETLRRLLALATAAPAAT